VLTGGILCSLGLHLRADYWGPPSQVYFFKPLTTILIIILALPGWGVSVARYRIPIMAGLVFSLAGDALLMGGRDYFVPGLVAFLLAHICYCRAFWPLKNLGAALNWLPLYLVYSSSLLFSLWPHLGSLKIPVTVYALVLAFMGWTAAARWKETRNPAAARAAWGAVLFMLSDSTLAVNRFAVRFEVAGFLVMTTYIAAQWLIASSIYPTLIKPDVVFRASADFEI
jgi:uncharacterized membrane protein YhhN